MWTTEYGIYHAVLMGRMTKAEGRRRLVDLRDNGKNPLLVQRYIDRVNAIRSVRHAL